MTAHVDASTATPGPSRRTPQLADFRARCSEVAGAPLSSAAELHDFSVRRPHDFWRLLLDWSGLVWDGDPDPVVTGDEVEHAAFFPGVRLNYSENLLRPLADVDDDAPALTSVHRGRPAERFTRGELRAAVECAAGALGRRGIGVGDRVVVIAPNHAGAVVVALAVAARGATLSTANPDMGPAALIGRFEQVDPVMLVLDRTGLGSGETTADKVVTDLLTALPTVAHVVLLDDLPLLDAPGVTVDRMAALVAEAPVEELDSWPRLPFDHPLWVMFSSGTTGAPKAMVHGAGGSVLEHVKEHRLHGDLDGRDTLYFHTTTAWMMWNWQLSALAVGAHVVLYDGPVSGPETLWQLAAEHRVTVFGTSPAYLQLCQDHGYRPRDEVDLRALRAILSTGAVLHDWQFEWLADAAPPVPVQTISGGTDIVGCFVLGHPEELVRPGRAQSLSLGLDVAAVDDAGRPVVGEVGALVCRRPFPSRPTGFLRDADGRRFHDAYFAEHPGVWTHGDLIEIDASGSARIHGRSDGVLNVDGIRIGPSEIYAILRRLPEVGDAMAVEQRDPDRPGGTRLVLLVVLRPGHHLDDRLSRSIRATLRREGSPAHVPELVFQVAQLPYTHNGKRSEAAARAALNGDPVPNGKALRDPGCLDEIAALRLRTQPSGRPIDEATSPAPDGGAREDDVPRVVTRAFRDVLGIQDLEPDADFFDSGGSSRKSMTLLRRLRIELGRPVAMETFLAAPSIAELTAQLAAADPDDAPRFQLLKPGKPSEAPLFLVHGAYGDVYSYHRLAQSMNWPGAVYGVCGQITAPDGTHRSVQDLAAEHVTAVAAMHPEGPVRLAGYSLGGLLAFEMARLLTAAGREVDFLGLLDPAPPIANLSTRERRMRALGKRLAVILPGFSDSTLRQELRAHFRTATLTPEKQALRGASRMANEYRWAPYAGHVTYFRATRRIPVVTNMMHAWRRVAPDLTVVRVPGAHHDLLRDASAPVLAARLTQALPRTG